MVRTIVALALQCLMGALSHTFKRSHSLSTRQVGRHGQYELPSVDVILPDIEFQLCRRDSQLGFLGIFCF